MSTQTGQAAEDQVCDYLRQRKFKILDRNWRTKFCEIDIVARKKDVVHLVEVKYRSSDAHGSGLEYITKSKQQQLRRAALAWVTYHQWEGDYQVDVAAVDANGRINYLDNIIIE